MLENSYQAKTTKAFEFMETKQDDDWIPFHLRERISPIRIFAICCNQITMQFIWIPLCVLTKPYCMKLGLSHYSTTLVLMIGNTVGFIVPPIIASISDSTTFKYGRRRPFLIVGEILVITGFLLICFCREISENSAIFNFVTGQILAYLGGNIANGPGRAMCSDVVPPSQQVLVSNMCVFDGAIAGVIANSIGAFKLYKYTNLSNESFVLIVSAGIGFVALIVSVLFTPEERLREKPLKRNPIHQILDSFHLIDSKLLNVLLAFFFFQIGSTEFSIQASNYVAMHVFKGVPNKNDGVYDSGIAYAQFLSLLQTVFQVFYSFFNTRFVNKYGFKFAWATSTFLLFLSNLLFYLVPNKYFLIVPYVLFGISGVIAFSIPYAYVSLVTPTEQLAGCMTLIILFGNIGGILVMIILTMFVGSFQIFLDNPGRLVGISTIFALISFYYGKKGYHEY